ncbi:MAG TPA: hypothetical protein HPP56_09745 [Nitrospirae bacterium]|nr:hypothetical protein [Nitrospirota bacterium]
MFKIFSYSLILILVLLSFITNSLAQDKPKIKIKQISGYVVVYDNSIKTMTIKGKKAEITILLDDKTVVKENKKLKNHNDIKVGDKVVIKYSQIEGKNIAKSVEIKTDTTNNK